MKDPMNRKMSRRSLLKGAASLAGVAVAAPLVLTSIDANAAAKVSKAAMQYRDKPNGSKQCSTCLQFIPGKSASANGTCKVVAGSISPHGYCLAWAPKS
jgi:secreted PhoX family phosphatase